MNSPDKKIVLVFVGNYLPGYKAGGILRSIVNTVDHLHSEFEFRIVTRDRDVGDGEPYLNVNLYEWQRVGNALVFYLPPHSETVHQLAKLIQDTPHDVLYLNSFFDPLTIRVLFGRMLGLTGSRPVIVAPWGEFAWASLSQKYLKKWLFMLFARSFGLYRNVIWRASSELEKEDIIKAMKINPESIQIAGDFPIKQNPASSSAPKIQFPANHEGLKIIFLSRISREKNIDYALRILSKIKTNVVYDIYGPAENETYWKECKDLIQKLPPNVTVRYLGSVAPDQVINVFSQYDLFLFPTGGEAYGHVIAESLSAGTPVLISTETPWRQLQKDEFGWDVNLANEDQFVNIIEEFASLSVEKRLAKRAVIKARIPQLLIDPIVLESNRQLFLRALKLQ
ncbi:MAG TPA: glycosyltransferase family 4 protein [Syntrophales bacterium]|nr:glycosyltransferase family 4 protein [Syntrophales bacterium]